MPSWPVGKWVEHEAADDSWSDDLADDERYREIFGGITEENDGTASV
jgi:hypothetical protein